MFCRAWHPMRMSEFGISNTEFQYTNWTATSACAAGGRFTSYRARSAPQSKAETDGQHDESVKLQDKSAALSRPAPPLMSLANRECRRAQYHSLDYHCSL